MSTCDDEYDGGADFGARKKHNKKEYPDGKGESDTSDALMESVNAAKEAVAAAKHAEKAAKAAMHKPKHDEEGEGHNEDEDEDKEDYEDHGGSLGF